MRRCKKCGLEKEEVDFKRWPSGSLYGKCRDCCNEYAATWQRKTEAVAYKRDYYQKNKKRMRATNKAWDDSHKEARAHHMLRSRLKRMYGMTPECRDRIFRSQDGRCRICNCKITLDQFGHAIDHNHVTGKVRGILCPGCNTGIGLFRENTEALLAAIAYIEEHNGHS